MEIKTDLNIGDVVSLVYGNEEHFGTVYKIEVGPEDNTVRFEVSFKSYETEYLKFDRHELMKLVRDPEAKSEKPS